MSIQIKKIVVFQNPKKFFQSCKKYKYFMRLMKEIAIDNKKKHMS